MQLTLIAFGIARDILGGKQVEFELGEPYTVTHLLEALQQQYPQINGLKSIKVAVNSEYANNDQLLKTEDEIVLIPPVSGG